MFLANSSNVIKFSLVFFEVSEGDNGSGLFMDQLSEAGLVLDDGIGNIKGLAKGRQEDDSLDGINISSNKDQLGLLLFNEVGDVVKSELKGNGSFSLFSLFVLDLFLGSCSKSVGFLFSGFRGVFSEDFNELRGWVKILLLVGLSRGLKN